MRTFPLALATLIALVLAPLSLAAPAEARVDLQRSRGDIIELTNQERAQAGLGGLRRQKCLMANAQRHAERLARAGSLRHQDLGSIRSDCSVPGWVGENVLYNHRGTGAAAVSQWMHSSGHRANILFDRYRTIGTGVAYSRRHHAWFAVQVFGGGSGR